MGILTKDELEYLEESLKRRANEIEKDIVGAQWSEHCSYKSSKKYLRLSPTRGNALSRVLGMMPASLTSAMATS